MSDSNRTQLIYKVEGSFGAAVGTAIAGGQLVRYNKSSITHDNLTVLSDEIIATGARSDQMVVGYVAKGTVSSELSYGGYTDDWIEAWCGGTFTANVVKAGAAGSINRSFLIEDGSLDVNQYFRFQGMVFDTWNYAVEQGKIITTDFGLLGIQGLTAGTSAFASPTVVTTNPVLTAATGLTSLLINGSGSAAKVTKLTFEGKRNLRERRYIGGLTSDDFGRGFIEVGGTLEVYFQDVTLFNLFLNNTGMALSFTLGPGGTKSYQVSIPVIKIGDGVRAIPGGNADIFLTCKWTGFYSPGVGYVMQITRLP